jgi:hypothetical protein
MKTKRDRELEKVIKASGSKIPPYVQILKRGRP